MANPRLKSETPPPEERPARGGRRLLRWLGRSVLALLVLGVLALACGALWVRGRLSDSLPRLEGEMAMSGLTAPVRIERDALGIPTISAANRLDAARATGFLHAQERYFQMDFLRRQAAGELAELAGERLLRADRRLRLHRFRDQSVRILSGLSPAGRSLLVAYSQGVNEGLGALEGKPFEYLLLGAEPAPWKPEDSLLAQLSMFLLLQDETGEYESMLALMRDELPAGLVAFLTPLGSEWDAPLIGGPLPALPVPGPEVTDLRGMAERPAAARRGLDGGMEDGAEEGIDEQAASNAWAVAGSHTADGRALLAVDMHLALSAPNIWYRVAMVWPSGGGGEHRVTGVTIPGVPLVVVGGNGAIAWGFTNSRIDSTDVVLVEPAAGQPDAYLTPAGPRPFVHHREILRTSDGKEEALDVPWTIWGPMLDKDHRGRRRALRWAAHQPEAVNLDLVELETARDVGEALNVARRSGIPAQNFVVADAAGHIGWTIAGRIPRRQGFDGRFPASWADGSRRWNGWLADGDVPRVVDPAGGRIWSANQRMTGGGDLSRLGDGNYVLGARARQVRDGLFAVERARREDMLRIQLDDRAPFLERWHALLLATLTPEALAADPRRRELRGFAESWGGRAAVDSVGYRAVREFYDAVAERVFEPLVAPCRRVDPEFDYAGEIGQMDGPLWKLVSERPPHLLDPRWKSWGDLFLAAADAVAAGTPEEGEEEAIPLAERTWGERNRAAIRHLFSRSVPGAGRWLDMPADPLPGDVFVPRVQTPTYGASQRLVIAPGAESAAIFHMPGGQSGNPLSPHYRDQHAAWVRGDAAPFLPGPAESTLTLVPQTRQEAAR
jgi:penicillin amidase